MDGEGGSFANKRALLCSNKDLWPMVEAVVVPGSADLTPLKGRLKHTQLRMRENKLFFCIDTSTPDACSALAVKLQLTLCFKQLSIIRPLPFYPPFVLSDCRAACPLVAVQQHNSRLIP